MWSKRMTVPPTPSPRKAALKSIVTFRVPLGTAFSDGVRALGDHADPERYDRKIGRQMLSRNQGVRMNAA